MYVKKRGNEMKECRKCVENINIAEQNTSDGVIYLINPPSAPCCTGTASGNVDFSLINMDFLNNNKIFSDIDINIKI
jgi:hypothetical protein